MKYIMSINVEEDDPAYVIPFLLENICEVIKSDGLGNHIYVEQFKTKNSAVLKEKTNGKNN